MRFPSKNYVLLSLFWIILLMLGVGALKIDLVTETSNTPAWLEQKLITKKNDTAVKKLNMSMPSLSLYQDLMKANANPYHPLNHDALIAYYQQITHIMPHVAESFSLLGFSYYHQGNKEKAFDAFQKSFYINPKFFYNAFNLGMMYLEANKRPEAMKIFTLALEQNPTESLQIIATSKIYQDILSANRSYNVIEHLKENYHALEVLQNHLKNDPNVTMHNLKPQIKFL